MYIRFRTARISFIENLKKEWKYLRLETGRIQTIDERKHSFIYRL